jgi:hypothetical protein
MSTSSAYSRRFRRRPKLGLSGWFVVAPCITSLALFPASAAAQPAAPAPPEKVELQFASGAGCPSQAAFVSEVGARIRRPIEWVASNPTTLIVVTLQQAGEHATGKLEVTRSTAEPTRREFIAASCAEVGSALALVTALTLDPNARTEPLPPPSNDVTTEPTPAPVTVAPAVLAPPVATPPTAAPAPAADAAPARQSPAEPSPLPAPDYAAWLGPSAGISVGYAPKPLVTLGLSLGARLRTKSSLSPSLQLTPLWGKTGTTGPAATGGTFAWAMARLEACPSELQLAAPLALAACAAGELGRLSARGSASNITPVAAERWWLAAGVTAALHFRQGPWFARLGAQLLFPTIRDEFVFYDPERSIHQPSLVTYGANLGLGFELGQ